jgi:hypothetical protein
MRRTIVIAVLCAAAALTQDCADAWAWADTEHALRDAGAREYEVLAAEIQSRGSSMSHLRQIDSLIDTDCGAFGVFHLQPHQAAAWGISTTAACPIRDSVWAAEMTRFLHGNQSARRQLEAWRRITAPVRQHIRRLPTTEKAAILALANTGPARVTRYGEMTGWRIDLMLDWYIAERPTAHRYRRAQYIREQVIASPVAACRLPLPMSMPCDMSGE